ncbi:MAG: exodeoxyribonuclease V subunit gamma [Acidimicrobiales bacterium]
MLHLHRSARADYLADALSDVLANPLVDPMAREVVAVPTRGVERWLSQRLSQRLGAGAALGDGVCANIDWPFPGALVVTAVAAAFGPAPAGMEPPWVDADPDPWSPRSSVWALLEVVDEHLGDPSLAPLEAHLRAASPSGPGPVPRRFTTVRHLADLFDRYAVHRPDMLLAWARAGSTASAAEPGRGQGAAWQAELWRLLRQMLGTPSLAERLEEAPARLEARPELLAPLPERLSCFGLTRLPSSHLRILRAIAAHRDVHLFLLHPSANLWDSVSALALKCSSGGRWPPAALLRRDDPTAELPENPLLRSWGRDAREMQLVLASQGVGGGERRLVEGTPHTLLGLIQADIRADRRPPGPPPGGQADRRPALTASDRSLQVHSCHGRARQVEVAREAVLHLLAEDPTLEPRDVIVMCPDIETFAPLVNATFGPAGLSGAPELRARLADRSLRQTNPLLAVAAHLLELAGSRVSATQVLDLASREAVCRRFDLDEDALSRIERWLSATGVRWGLDAEHRAPWHLDRLAASTWRAGIDRLLLGVAMGDEGAVFGGALPFGDMTADGIELAGRLAELVDRLRTTLDQLSQPQTVQEWVAALLAGTARLACPAADQSWQAEQLRRTLEDVVQSTSPLRALRPEGGPLLDVAEARALLADCLRGRPTRANFRTGDTTICTLVPMRSVPHRVVCLLGLDDGTFPRPRERDGDDLLLATPLVGDRDVPSEDRQLLLDALLAATQHLVITYEGRDQHLNQPRPPSVPVAELLDQVDRTVRLEGSTRPARQAVLVEHPLQAFDPRNYAPGQLCGEGPWRFDQLNLAGAKASAGEKVARRPFLGGPLPALDGPTVQLSALVRFLEHPVRAFLRERLGYYAGDFPQPLQDSLPLELSPLERWSVGDRLLATRMARASLDQAVIAERARGLLPPGPAGEAALAEVLAVVRSICAEVDQLGCTKAAGAPIEANVMLPDGRSLVGTVPGVHGRTILRCTYSKLGPKHRLRAWAQFLALSAAHPALAPEAVTIGQAEGSTGERPRLCTQKLLPLAGGREATGGAAMASLAVLVDLFDRGMREPLHLYCATSAAWAQAATRPELGDDPFAKANQKWASDFDERQGEGKEPEHIAVLGSSVAFDQLLECAPADGEGGPGWPMSQPTRFGRLATRLWEPLLAHEDLRER